MKLSLDVGPELPPLFWSATIYRQGDLIDVRAGSAVEVMDHALVEGAWSGPFQAFDFNRATTFTGTGLVARQNDVIVSTPTHTLAPVFLLPRQAAIILSNSLPGLLGVSGLYLDPSYPFYDQDIMSIMFGLKAYRKRIPTKCGAQIHLFYMTNIVVRSDLTVVEAPKSPCPHFDDFDSYFDFLQRETRLVAANAAAPERRIRYEPLATVSSGYDSPACSVLAKAAGARRAVTLTQARSDFSDVNDSGTKIGEALGLQVTEFEKSQYLPPGSQRQEIEVLASGYGGDDIIWIGAREILKNSLLFAGYHGDKIWDVSESCVSSDVKRGDPSGGSMLEFRLRTGFFLFPVPFIACLRHADIQRISISEDMADWRIGGTYDRPIPRRIVEEAGVPREWFGQTKKAVAMPYQTTGSKNPLLEEAISKDSVFIFRRYLRDNLITTIHKKNKYQMIVRYLLSSYKIKRIITLLGAADHLKILLWRHQKPISDHNFVTAWAANLLREDYLTGRNVQLPVESG